MYKKLNSNRSNMVRAALVKTSASAALRSRVRCTHCSQIFTSIERLTMKLKTDPKRQNENMHGLTGIFIRAIGTNGKQDAYDLAELDAESLTAWLTRDGGSNPLAENTVRVMLGHEQIIPANTKCFK